MCHNFFVKAPQMCFRDQNKCTEWKEVTTSSCETIGWQNCPPALAPRSQQRWSNTTLHFAFISRSTAVLQCCSAAVLCQNRTQNEQLARDGREVSNYNWICATVWYYGVDTYGELHFKFKLNLWKITNTRSISLLFWPKIAAISIFILGWISSLLSSHHCMSTSSSYNFLHTRKECSRLSI